jgi:DNA recombination protein RmuC
MQVGKDVSSLKDVLQPPKLRGGFGELLLEQLVKQVLPPDYYSTQYRFRDGAIVDLVIHTPDGLVPVDSKFPIESFRRLLEAEDEGERARQRRAFYRDVRTRIEEVVKYIRPADDTLDFALMYVPAENIYYEAIATTSDESPMTFALERGVYLCSPNTFHAFLQVVLRGFQEVRAQENAQDIVARLGQLRLDFGKFRQEFERLGTHLGHARSKHEDIEKLVGRFSDRLELDIPVQPSLSEPAETPGQAALPRPTTVNGSDESS